LFGQSCNLSIEWYWMLQLYLVLCHSLKTWSIWSERDYPKEEFFGRTWIFLLNFPCLHSNVDKRSGKSISFCLLFGLGLMRGFYLQINYTDTKTDIKSYISIRPKYDIQQWRDGGRGRTPVINNTVVKTNIELLHIKQSQKTISSSRKSHKRLILSFDISLRSKIPYPAVPNKNIRKTSNTQGSHLYFTKYIHKNFLIK